LAAACSKLHGVYGNGHWDFLFVVCGLWFVVTSDLRVFQGIRISTHEFPLFSLARLYKYVLTTITE
jgi:hypothetical protein